MAAGEGGQPPGGEGEGQGKRTWSFSFKRAVNVAKGLNPIQTKRVSQIKDVAFEKVEGTKKYIQDMDISGEVGCGCAPVQFFFPLRLKERRFSRFADR
uniref:Uncharacterized protein n=1 Tax=Chloropicon primus TaxID=1764295 RepID=A0A7S2T2B1_9CHLO